jgi:hypothetical protein
MMSVRRTFDSFQKENLPLCVLKNGANSSQLLGWDHPLENPLLEFLQNLLRVFRLNYSLVPPTNAHLKERNIVL